LRFEWSVGAPESHQVPRQIARLLLDKGHAKNAAEAEEKHNRLFLFVLKRLTEKGVKRLSADQCAEQLALPPLSEEDQATLENVVVRSAPSSRVSALLNKDSREQQRPSTSICSSTLPSRLALSQDLTTAPPLRLSTCSL